MFDQLDCDGTVSGCWTSGLLECVAAANLTWLSVGLRRYDSSGEQQPGATQMPDARCQVPGGHTYDKSLEFSLHIVSDVH